MYVFYSHQEYSRLSKFYRDSTVMPAGPEEAQPLTDKDPDQLSGPVSSVM